MTEKEIKWFATQLLLMRADFTAGMGVLVAMNAQNRKDITDAESFMGQAAALIRRAADIRENEGPNPWPEEDDPPRSHLSRGTRMSQVSEYDLIECGQCTKSFPLGAIPGPDGKGTCPSCGWGNLPADPPNWCIWCKADFPDGQGSKPGEMCPSCGCKNPYDETD